MTVSGLSGASAGARPSKTRAWLSVPTAAVAHAVANRRVSPLAGGRTDAKLEIFPRSEYRKRATPRNYIRSVRGRSDIKETRP